MKILIISTNAIGDTYLSASAIAPLRARFPERCEITMVAHHASRELVRHLDVDRAVFLPSKSAAGIVRCVAALARVRYDVVFSFFPGRVNSILFFACRAGRRFGYINFRPVREWHPLPGSVYIGARKTDKQWTPDRMFIDRISVCLSAAEIECETIARPRLQAIAAAPVGRRSAVLIHPTSSQVNKSLSVEAVKGIVDHIVRTMGIGVTIIGWNNDLAALKRSIAAGTRVELLEDPSLTAFVHTLERSQLFIGVDSFPLHVADAYEAPYIGVFGPTRSDAFSSNPYNIDFCCEDLSRIPSGELTQRIGAMTRLQLHQKGNTQEIDG